MNDHRLNAYRDQASAPQNQLIDDLVAGELDRAQFLRRASVFGLSVPFMGAALMSVGMPGVALAAPQAVNGGGRIKVGLFPPSGGTIEPHLTDNRGAINCASICSEYLVRGRIDLSLAPELAVSWTPNGDASKWTFKLRRNVKFHTGQSMTADDVVTTFKRLTDPASKSAALSAFQGVLTPDGVVKVDDFTVRFDLEAPTASFPYLTSTTTYQAIILPKDYQIGDFTKKPVTTGAFRMTSFDGAKGATFERFDGWWGGKAVLDGVDATFYAESAAADAALISNQVQLLDQVQLSVDRALFNNSSIKILKAPGSTHREVPMRVDMDPFKDKRARQAVAYSLDRPAILKKLFNNLGKVGNDSPFAPAFPSTAKVPQRVKNIAKAKQLAQASGLTGKKVTLTTYKNGELPALAQIIQQSVKPLGLNISLKVLTGAQYFGGNPQVWLSAPMTITDWGHRSVPNVFLTSAFQSKGIWNAAHWKNAKYDKLSKQFLSAVSLADQKKFSKQIQLLMLEETPTIFPYFYDFLAGARKNVNGYNPDPIAHVYLSKTSLG